MKIDRIRVQNFRSYQDSGIIDVGDKLVLVGENNAGKSNILRAMELSLNISPTSPHKLRDFHLKDTDENIEIEVWLTGLTDEEEDIFEKYISEGFCG